jgi:hypothetical protein
MIFDYLLDKIKDAMISLDNTIGYLSTNLSLLCQIWIDRLCKHLINNEYKLNMNKFMVEHPPTYNEK